MLGFLIGLAVTLAVVWLVIKKYQPHTVLLLAGLLLLGLTAILFPHTSILFPKAKSTGWAGFDVVDFVTHSLSTRTAELGMIIMSAGGFAKYMDTIGATDAMVALCIRPLKLLRAPYVVLALGYAVGQIFHIFIPSAAGLAMLLLVTFYPTLVRLGVSPAAAAAMIGTTGVMDLGPASAGTNLAARTAGLDAATYFAHYQLPTAAIVMVVISALTYVTARYFDRKSYFVAKQNESENDAPALKVPVFYALLPMVPLTLILVFSPLLVRGVRLDVVTAMMIGALLALLCELARTRDARAAMKGFTAFFAGMGKMFSDIVSLIVCTETFAAGLQAIGMVGFLIVQAQNGGFGFYAMTVVMCAIVTATAVITGSGNAAFFSFASLAPKIASGFGAAPVTMLLPMQLCAGIARSASPVAGVIIAVSGTGQCSPIEIVRRTAIPVAGGLLTVLLCTAFVG